MRLLTKSENSSQGSIYAPLNFGEEDDLSDTNEFSIRRKGRLSSRATQLCLIGLTIINILICWISIYYSSLRSCENSKIDFPNPKVYSPFLERSGFPRNTSIIKIDGPLFDHDPPSIYRQPPSVEVDQAWEEISHIGTHVITGEQVLKIGKDPNLTVRAPEEWGFGQDAYLAQIDVFHQIHCLDVLRREAYYDHYFRPIYGDKEPSVLHKQHFGHCLHVLLQNIMCAANLDVITYNWIETQAIPYPDFYINHECRNFDAIMEWQKQNEVSNELFKIFPKMPEGTVPLKASKEMLGWAAKHNGSTSTHEHGDHVAKT